ncbi:PorH family porin [Corynebacterium pacaense]|uniref:PorH family porin n=1 Tax=Corynebacterium pacaense TaxID=1816684 RepID=UPI0015C471C6|nr:PorH family porin [Corynebacterium pacaense]
MDLSLIQSAFADFATFGSNIGTAVQGIPGLLKEIVEFVSGAKGGLEVTSTAFKAFSS